MLLTLVAGLVLAAAQQLDTTVVAERGQRLHVNAYGGDVTVGTWTRNAVRVQANESGRSRVELLTSGTTVNVRTQGGRHGPPSDLSLRITVPVWMPLTLSGVNTDARVTGIRAPISVETVEGEIDVSGGDGLISLRSVQGSVSLRGARGRISVNSVNEDVTVANSTGEIILETVDAGTVDANTINGDITYAGPIRSGGRYALSTHNGDILLTVPEGVSANVAVSTFNGEFESEFPVPVSQTRKGKGFNFVLGSGSAQVTLESFQGTIQLVRPGGRADRERRNRQSED